MKIKDFFIKTTSELYQSIKRFPITIALSTAFVVIMIMIQETQANLGYGSKAIEELQRMAMILALGVPLTGCIKLFFEKHKKENILFEGISLTLCAGFLAFYYFFMLKDFHMVSITRYIGISFVLYLCFIFIPYLFKRENFEMYVMQLLSRFSITIIYSVVLFLGLSAILFTVDQLLGVTIDSKIYFYTWLILAGVFAPIYFLAGVPASGESMEDYDYASFFKILLLYIVMPLLSIYMVILYIYFGKIIITQVWPIGLVSHLVLWYSALCVVIIFLTTPMKDNAWVEKFSFFLPKFILPILVMMFISMGIRINAYGITENRYFVVLLGLWVSGIMIYFSIKKVKRNVIIPVSLAIMALLSVIGPASAYSISKMSQNNRLSSILQKNGMLADSNIIAKVDVSEKDKKEISSILKYFEKDHSLKDVKVVKDDFKISDMEKTFGFSYIEGNNGTTGDTYFSYTIPQVNQPYDINGYDTLYDMRGYLNAINGENSKVQLTRDKGEVNISNGNGIIYTLKLSDQLKMLQSKYPNNTTPELADMMVIDENQVIKVKFIFSNIYGHRNPNSEETIIDGADFYVLVKIK